MTSVLVTDFERKYKNAPTRYGYAMNILLWQNARNIPAFLKADNMLIGLISGTGKTRVGKSTLACQIGYYVAWLLAGGADDVNSGQVIKKPTKPLRFKIFFDPEEMMKEMQNDEPNGVYILDEAKAIADSRDQIVRRNRLFADFVTKCAFKNHFLILVLPDFYNLSTEFACHASMFLCNCYLDRNYRRGYFRFYNERQKEYLYLRGKKLLGANARYSCGSCSFDGRFTSIFPYNLEEYLAEKQKALETKPKRTKFTERAIRERDLMILYLYKMLNYTYDEIIEVFNSWGCEWDNTKVHHSIQNAQKIKEMHQEELREQGLEVEYSKKNPTEEKRVIESAENFIGEEEKRVIDNEKITLETESSESDTLDFKKEFKDLQKA